MQKSRLKRVGTKLLYGFYAPTWLFLYGLMKLFLNVKNKAIISTNERLNNKEQKELILKVQSPYRQQKEQIDSLATYYMDIYRGSFILNFLLGAIAVFLAVLSNFSHEDSHSLWPSIAELVCLTIIFSTYRASHIWRWQKKAVDYRFMSEYFRHIEMLVPLGRNAPLLKPAAHHHTYDPGMTWMGWYINAFMRSIGPISDMSDNSDSLPHEVSLDNKYVATVQNTMSKMWLQNQYHYHLSLFKRYSRWETIADFVMVSLFLVTVCGVLLHIDPFGILADLHDQVIAVFGGIFTVLIVTALPAFMTAIHGITVQGEFERLAERSEATASYLIDFLQHFNEIKPDTVDHYGVTVGDSAVDAAQMMLEEIMDWQILYRAHNVELT